MTLKLADPPPNKAFQAAAIRALFSKLNPDDEPPGDLEDWIDSSLSLTENIAELSEKFPVYRWQGEPKKSMREELADELKAIIDQARGTGVSEQTIQGAVQDAGVQVTINRIQRGVPRSQYEEALQQLERLRQRFGEIVPAGPVRAVPIPPPPAPAVLPPPPPPAEAARAERFTEQAGMNVLATKDFYAALGIPRDATAGQINDRVRLFLSTFHPDVFSPAIATDVTRKLLEIRDTLTNPAQRASYDRTLGVAERVQAPTVTIQEGDPILYCLNRSHMGGLIMMTYQRDFGEFLTGRYYRVYVCPVNEKHKERIVNYYRGNYIGHS